MIYGIGTDIVEVKRMKKWIDNPEMISRFFNEKEIMNHGSETARMEHYAVRFSAKESFSKALGTGLSGFDLKDVFITNDENGKPELNVINKAADLLKERCGNPKVHISLSHEKEYAISYVIIEN